jgi:hypothetical protein
VTKGETATTSARRAKRFLMCAIVAKQPLGRTMNRERDAAVGANDDVAAIVALYERRVAPPIQQENALLPSQQRRRKRNVELVAND